MHVATIDVHSWFPLFLHIHTYVRSLAISSDNKELYAGYSNRQIAAWVKLKHDAAVGTHSGTPQEGDFEHLNMADNYYNHAKFVR